MLNRLSDITAKKRGEQCPPLQKFQLTKYRLHIVVAVSFMHVMATMLTMAAPVSTAMATSLPAMHVIVVSFHGRAAVRVLRRRTFNCQPAQTDCGHERQNEEKPFHIFAPENIVIGVGGIAAIYSQRE
jgi:hypothetical protein